MDFYEDGRIVQRFLNTSGGSLEFKYVVSVEGETVSLNNASVFPTFDDTYELGTAEVRALLNQIGDEVRAAGYKTLRISGLRVGTWRIADITIDLTR